MPEGPSIFSTAAKQNRLLGGKNPVVTSPQGRFTEAKLISGHRLSRVEPVGKHLFYHFSKSKKKSLLHIHLGRLGKFRYHDEDIPFPSPNCRLRLHTLAHTVDISGPTACHLITPDERQAILNRLGPDPLDPKADPAEAWEKIHRSKLPIGALLLDQSLIAGLGNILRAEILFRLKLHPSIRGNELTKKEFAAIWKDSVAMSKQAVKYDWLITTTPKDIGKPLSQAKGGRNEDRFYVYRRSTCRRCHSKIKPLTVGGRTIYLCPTCQPERPPAREI